MVKWIYTRITLVFWKRDKCHHSTRESNLLDRDQVFNYLYLITLSQWICDIFDIFL